MLPADRQRVEKHCQVPVRMLEMSLLLWPVWDREVCRPRRRWGVRRAMDWDHGRSEFNVLCFAPALEMKTGNY
jgi:hypothetical protein